MLEQAEPFPKEIFNLEVIPTPGHTKGSVSFLDKQNNLLFSGDTLFNEGIGRTDFNNSIPQQMQDSLNKLHEIMENKDIKLMPGHDY